MEDLDYFKCPDCGCRQLVLKHYYTISSYYAESLPCGCEESDDGVAYERKYTRTTSSLECYWLDDSHHFKERAEDYEDEDLEEPNEETDEENVFCSECYEIGIYDDCSIEYDPAEDEEETYDFILICAECDKEIEFGWSHEDRGGRIWPEETIKSDDIEEPFNPWKSFPEDKYIESWYEKGWLHPNSKRIYEQQGLEALRGALGYTGS